MPARIGGEARDEDVAQPDIAGPKLTDVDLAAITLTTDAAHQGEPRRLLGALRIHEPKPRVYRLCHDGSNAPIGRENPRIEVYLPVL